MVNANDIAGRLRFFVDRWQKITTDYNILDLVQHAHLKFCEGFENELVTSLSQYQMSEVQ